MNYSGNYTRENKYGEGDILDSGRAFKFSLFVGAPVSRQRDIITCYHLPI